MLLLNILYEWIDTLIIRYYFSCIEYPKGMYLNNQTLLLNILYEYANVHSDWLIPMYTLIG